MKRKYIALAAALLAAVLLAGCAVTGTEKDGLRLYCAVPLENHQGGDAIGSVTVNWDILPAQDKEARARAVLSLLLGGCHEQGFQSPLPAGTSLRGVEINGSTACVDFTGSYSQLSGMALTIADYCVTLSLTQLEGIYAVRITANGQELAYRDSNLFMASDVLLTSMDDVVRMVTAQLYFPDENGVLTPEERLLTQYEGQSVADVVLSALAEGPTQDGLLPLLPEGAAGITVRAEEGVCQLNLSADALTDLPSDAVAQLEEGVAVSLLSLEGVSTVQVYLDGAYRATYE